MATFLLLSGRLKNEPRRGWATKVGVKNPESVADHVFRTALIALLIGDVKGFNSELMIRMALIHDLPEAVLGNKTPTEYRNEATKKRAETIQMRKFANLLPKAIETRFMETWRMLSRGKCVEAKLVKEIDRFEMLLQAAEYAQQGYSMSSLKEFFESASREIHDEDLKEMALGVMKSLESAEPGD